MIYEYEKGVGWTLKPSYEVLRYTLNDGSVLTCENRMPKAGELFYAEGNFRKSARNLSKWTASALRERIRIYRENPASHFAGVYSGTDPDYCTVILEGA